MTAVYPRVSVGLPVFNGAKYLGAAVESFLAQSYREFELIIADNASTDGTEHIARGYAQLDSRVRYFRWPTNIGAAANFNRVVELASGEYFKWMTHDDMYEPDFLRQCVEALDANKAVVLACSRVAEIDEHGFVVGDSYDNDTFLRAQAARPSDRFRRLVCDNHSCIAVFGLMRLAELKRTPLIAPYVGSDRVLLAEFGLMGRFHQVPMPFLLHREHGERSTRKMPDLRERIIWFDPTKKGVKTFPNWRLLKEYMAVIRRARLSSRERRECYGHVLRWLRYGHWRLLCRDLNLRRQ